MTFITGEEIVAAAEGIPRTVVKMDEDADICIYREHAMPQPEESPSRLRLEFLGDACPYPECSPYFIARDRVRTPEEALDWMAHLGAKRWTSEQSLYAIAKALGEVLRAEISDLSESDRAAYGEPVNGETP